MTLLAHYRLNGDAGDASGYGNDGSGDITYQHDMIDRCGYSDGTKYVDIGTLGSFGSGMANPLTVMFWFKSSASPASIERILGVLNNGDYTGFLVNTRRSSAGDFEMFLRGAADSGNRRWFYTSSGGWNDGAWHHVALVVGATIGDSAIYVDGVSRAITNADFDATLSSTDFDENVYLFAENNKGSRLGTLVFSMDDLRIYNEALPSRRIQAIYNGGKGSEECQPWQRLIQKTIRPVVRQTLGAA